MYVPGTTLILKEQIAPDAESGEPYAYNRVKFVITSPVGILDTEGWEGEDATFCVLVPLSNFGGNINRPFGQIRELYDIESVPEAPGEEGVDPLPVVKTVEEQEAEIAAIKAARAEALRVKQTPEEVFAVAAPGVAPKEGEKRGRTTLPEVLAPSKKDELTKNATTKTAAKK